MGILALAAPARAAIDDITKAIWKMNFGVSDAQFYLNGDSLQGPNAVWLAADDDGDGVSNGAEIGAGTNPFDGSKTVKITNTVKNGANVEITFPTARGKKYVLQSTATLGNPASWAPAGAEVIGDTNPTKMLTVPFVANTFLRVLVQDVDSDNDGASDWAELIAGFNPNNATTNGGITLDGAALTSAIATSDRVTVQVTKSSATQPLAGFAPVETGSITVSRGGPLKFHAITVPLQKSGTATEGTDYDALPASVTFPVGAGEVVLAINPKSNGNRKTNVTAIVKALAGGGYSLGSVTSGGVVINPAGVANGTGLTAKYQNASSSTYATQVLIFGGAAEMSRTDPVIDFGTTANTIVSSIALGNPCVVTTTRATALTSGDVVTIAGVTGGTFSPTIIGTFVVTVLTGNTFTVPVNCTVLPTSVTSATLTTTNSVTAPNNNANGWGSLAVGGPRGMSPQSASNAFSVRWTGQILPRYSEAYTIDFRSDESARVWVNGQLLIDRWTTQSATDYTNTIALRANVLHDITIEYWNNTGAAEAKLYWWSLNQVKEIIPQERLFPEPTQPNKVTPITSSLAAVGYVGTPFSFNVTSADTGGTITYALATNSGPLPPGSPAFALNASTGAITGTPTVEGTYNVAINSFNPLAGGSPTGSSILNITIFPVGGVTREILAANGTAVSDIVIPPATVIPAHDTIPTFDDDTDYPNNTGERLRGYLVPPKTGNYYFWLAANNAAELWISTDSEYVNRVRSATLTASSSGKKVWSTTSSIASVSIGNPCTVTTTAPHNLPNGTSVAILGVSGGAFAPSINSTFAVTVTGATTFTVQSNCTATPADATGTLSGTQRSPWLSLVAGQKYYFEVLHNTSGDADDHMAVGWCQDDIGTVPSTSTTPNSTGVLTSLPNGGGPLQGYPLSGTVPGYIFQPYDYPVVTPPTGTLYAGNVGPQAAAITSASGSANLQVNAAETEAILHFKYLNLASPKTSYHLHVDGYTGDPALGGPVGGGGQVHPQGEIVFDIDDADKNPLEQTADGGYIWTFAPIGSFLNVLQIREALQKGKVYINIHSVGYPAGEIRGTFGLIDGSQTPPDASLYTGVNEPVATDSASDAANAARFLNQASFGASPTDVAAVQSSGFASWINSQITQTAEHVSDDVVAGLTADINNPYPSSLFTDSWWKYSITGPAQLRRRLAFALSQIMVVSWANDTGPLARNGRILADYYDKLVDYSLPTTGLADSGNFRGILKAVTLTPAMGLYLDMRANQKGDDAIGRHPNENYAREIMQLFSVGIYRMWDDGRFVLGSDAGLVPTYTQPSIIGLSNLLTGWNYAQPNLANGRAPTSFSPAADYLNPMVLVPTQHELSSKLLLNNVISPAATGRTPRVSISSIGTGNPCTVTTTTIHGLKTGDTVTLAGITGGTFTGGLTAINVAFQATVASPTTFTVPVNCTAGAGTAGTVTGATVTPAAISGTAGIVAVTGSQADNSGTGANHAYDLYGLNELDRAINNIVNNDNVPPYICRQLIQRLVTSDPSPGYIYRVVQKFKDNGSGVRGDLLAVVTQILLDGEARRSSATQNSTTFGKQREPILRLTGPARAFPAPAYALNATTSVNTTYAQLGGVNSNRLRITTSSPNDFSSGFTVALNFRDNYVTPMPSVPNPVSNPTSANYSVSASLGIAATHLNIASIGTGIPTVITTAQNHGLPGPTNTVWPTGVSGKFSGTINGGVTATKIDDTSFSLNINTTNVFQVASVAVGTPCVVTTVAPHGLALGSTTTGVTINGVVGGGFSSTINATNLSVVGIDATTFSVTGVNCTSPPTGYTAWREVSNPCLVTTQVVNHGLTTGDSVTMASVSGGSFTPTINGTFDVTVVSPSSFTIASSCAVASTANTGNIVGGNTLDVTATGMVNVTYAQAAGSNIMTVNTGGPQTNVAIPVPNSATTTLKSKVYLYPLTRSSTAGIASIGTGNPCTVTTSAPHGLASNDSVTISGVTGGTFSPTILSTYTVTVLDGTSFTVQSNCTASPTAGTGTVTRNDNLVLGTGEGVYEVQTTTGSTSFTVFTLDTPVAARSGNVIMPKIATSYTPQTNNTIVQFNNNVNHNMSVGQNVWVDVPVVGNPLTDAEYVITNTADEDHFKTSYLPVTSALGTYPKPSGSNNGITLYPLVPPPLGRSGVVKVNQSTFNLGSTESSLTQSPLNAPTVFNYFFPDYKFPGTLANNGLDSPEFQLTTDTNVMNLTNSITNMFIGTGGGNSNVNGLCSFNNGSGQVVVNIGPFMTNAKTSEGGISGLVDELANLLVGAPLELNTKAQIVNFVNHKNGSNVLDYLPYTTPTNLQKRDRVRAIIHLILTSAEYAVQK